MDPTYKTWVFHGEQPQGEIQHKEKDRSYAFRMYQDACYEDFNVYILDVTPDIMNEDFTQRVEDA